MFSLIDCSEAEDHVISVTAARFVVLLIGGATVVPGGGQECYVFPREIFHEALDFRECRRQNITPLVNCFLPV